MMDEKKKNSERMHSDLLQRNPIVSFTPREMDIEITSWCNFRCRMCPHALTGNRAARHLKSEVLEKLHPLLPGCRRVMLQGDGEPLLYPHFNSLVRELASYGVLLCTTTNLSLLTEETAELMAEHFSLVTVSCDGPDRETYETIRRGGDFEVFKEKLALLMSFMDPEQVTVNCVVQRKNLDRLTGLLRFLKEYGIKKVMFSSLLTTPYLKNERDNPMFYPGMTKRKIEEAVEWARRNRMELTVNWDLGTQQEQCEGKEYFTETEEEPEFTQAEADAFLKIYEELHCVKESREISSGKYHCRGICKNLFEKIYVDTEGNLTLCCFGKTQSVGNILKTPVEKIWNGSVYQACRDAFFKGRLPNFCIGCRYLISGSVNALQAYPFQVTDMDNSFFDDGVFWKNR